LRILNGSETRNVSGLSLYNAKPPGKRFGGRIRFEKRAAGIYYIWRLEDQDGQFLGLVSRGVLLRVIPPGHDAWDDALAHAVEGIRRYRMNRQKFFKVEKWEWENESGL
jgi:hypothetical protein